MTITIRGESKRLAINNVPLSERLVVRKATGLPFESFVGEDRIGLDSIMVLWWLARRGEGEVMLTLTAAEADFPTDLEADDLDVSIDEPDPEADDPEA
jgi:hypothetical protein